MLHPDLSEVAYIMEGTYAALLIPPLAASLCLVCNERLNSGPRSVYLCLRAAI